MWQCPSHPDNDPSLSVSEGDNGRVLINCFAGCSANQVMESLGLGMRQLFHPHSNPAEVVLSRQQQRPTYLPVSLSARSGSGSAYRRGAYESMIHHVYIPDKVRLERCRYTGGKKACRWETKIGGTWAYAQGLRLDELPLYQERQLLMGLGAGEPIVLCESESSVDAIMEAGLYATTWAGGASNPTIPTLLKYLTGSLVVWIPDNDPAGIQCSQKIKASLGSHCKLFISIPDPGKDARDLLAKVGESKFMDSILLLGETQNRDNRDNRDKQVEGYISSTSSTTKISA